MHSDACTPYLWCHHSAQRCLARQARRGAAARSACRVVGLVRPGAPERPILVYEFGGALCRPELRPVAHYLLGHCGQSAHMHARTTLARKSQVRLGLWRLGADASLMLGMLPT